MTEPDPGWLTRAVAGKEKFLIGLLGLIQVYIAAVDWLVDPEKQLVIGLLVLCQLWLGADSPPPPPKHPDADSPLPAVFKE